MSQRERALEIPISESNFVSNFRIVKYTIYYLPGRKNITPRIYLYNYKENYSLVGFILG